MKIQERIWCTPTAKQFVNNAMKQARTIITDPNGLQYPDPKFNADAWIANFIPQLVGKQDGVISIKKHFFPGNSTMTTVNGIINGVKMDVIRFISKVSSQSYTSIKDTKTGEYVMHKAPKRK